MFDVHSLKPTGHNFLSDVKEKIKSNHVAISKKFPKTDMYLATSQTEEEL